jgi:hypothetical protein
VVSSRSRGITPILTPHTRAPPDTRYKGSSPWGSQPSLRPPSRCSPTIAASGQRRSTAGSATSAPWNDPPGALERYLGTTPETSNGRQHAVGQQKSVADSPQPVKPPQKEPAKPHRDLPPYTHAPGRWAKEVKGQLRYCGPCDDSQGVLEEWLEQKADFLAGGEQPAKGNGVTGRHLVNQPLEAKGRQLNTGELRQRTWEDYHAIYQQMINVSGRSRRVSDWWSADSAIDDQPRACRP